MLDQGWPQVFESFQSGIQSGMPIIEQFEYLGHSGPLSHRHPFFSAWQALDLGHDLGVVLSRLKVDFSSRAGDLLVLLVELDSELGGVGMERTFGLAANSVRKEQAELGQLLAKQGWVALSAKIALFAPWLVALVLLQLEQNRQAFASALGSLVLVLGLTLSLFAYFLVNKLGYLPLPTRVLNGAH
jgi:tight adherence protein B